VKTGRSASGDMPLVARGCTSQHASQTVNESKIGLPEAPDVAVSNVAGEVAASVWWKPHAKDNLVDQGRTQGESCRDSTPPDCAQPAPQGGILNAAPARGTASQLCGARCKTGMPEKAQLADFCVPLAGIALMRLPGNEVFTPWPLLAGHSCDALQCAGLESDIALRGVPHSSHTVHGLCGAFPVLSAGAGALCCVKNGNASAPSSHAVHAHRGSAPGNSLSNTATQGSKSPDLVPKQMSFQLPSSGAIPGCTTSQHGRFVADVARCPLQCEHLQGKECADTSLPQLGTLQEATCPVPSTTETGCVLSLAFAHARWSHGQLLSLCNAHS
jgi:hypothetical protein